MITRFYIAVLILCLFACSSNTIEKNNEKVKVEEPKPLTVGAENIDSILPELKGQKIGIVVNHTSMVDSLHVLDYLLAKGIDPDQTAVSYTDY